MMAFADFARLVQSVQRNCHVADARHAREMTLCNYLLEMREFYRWEHEVPLARALPRQELGSWISEREALWDGLQADALERLPLGEYSYDAFEVGAINAALVPQGLVYGAGYGRFGKPLFFWRNWSTMKGGRGSRCSSRAASMRATFPLLPQRCWTARCSCAETRCAAGSGKKWRSGACARPTAR